MNAQYGFEVITGIGVGINIGSLALMTLYAIGKRDPGIWASNWDCFCPLILSSCYNRGNCLIRSSGWGHWSSYCDLYNEQLD